MHLRFIFAATLVGAACVISLSERENYLIAQASYISTPVSAIAEAPPSPKPITPSTTPTPTSSVVCTPSTKASGSVSYLYGMQTVDTKSATSCLLPFTREFRDFQLVPADDSTGWAVIGFSSTGLTLTFSITQVAVDARPVPGQGDGPIVDAYSPLENDNVRLLIMRTSGKSSTASNVFTAVVDSNETCQSINKVTPKYFTIHNQCSAKVDKIVTPGWAVWHGTLTIPYNVIDGVLQDDSDFAVTVTHTVWRLPAALKGGIADGPAALPALPKTVRIQDEYCASPAMRAGQKMVNECTPWAQDAFININRLKTNVRAQTYSSVAADFGQPVGVPPHRLAVNAFVPTSTIAAAGAVFSDDSGKLLNIPQTLSSGIPDSGEQKAFQCRSCGTFQGTQSTAFTSTLTSTSTLGVNLKSVGVDQSPFEFTAVSYPIDSGYKFAASADELVGLTYFQGTTTTGYAHDAVFQYQNEIDTATTRFSYDAFNVVADRSSIASPSPGQYPSVHALVDHSTDTQATFAYSISGKAAGPNYLPDSRVNTLSVLVRYGTQYVANSNSIDVAVSDLADPAVLDIRSFYGTGLAIHGAGGYRSVQVNYAPIDAPVDLHAGMNGEYGLVDLTDPTCRAVDQSCRLHTKVIDLSLTAYRFGDGIEARDTSTKLSLSYPFWDTFSLQAAYTNAQVALSEAALANNIVVSDALGGRDYLPNGSYSAQLAYSANTGKTPYFETSAGYTQVQSQNCATSLFKAPPPCFGYRQPSATGSLYWVPFRSYANVFLDAQIQGSTDTAFSTATSSILKPAYAYLYGDTSNHVVRTATFGGSVGCTSLLLSTANRGGDPDAFGKSPPQPGYTDTAALELIAGHHAPPVLVAWSHVVNTTGTPSVQNVFGIRLQYGVPPQVYATALCSSK